MKTVLRNLADRIASACCFVTDFLGNRWQERPTLRQIRALDPEEAARLLTEVGLTPQAFEHSMALPFPSEDLFLRAMDTFDVDPDEFCVRNPAWFQDMERTCMRCAERRACRRTMSRGEFMGWHRRFCPNAEDFAQIISSASGSG